VKNRETRAVQLPAMLAVGSRPDVLLWRQQVGLFRQMNPPHAPVYVGTPGMADVGMVVAVQITPELVGRRLGVAVQAEMKAGGRQSERQRDWQAAFEARGGIYRLVRSADDMRQLVEDVQHGRW
jgi:hypothetical protein